MKGENRRAEDDEHLRAMTDIVERLRQISRGETNWALTLATTKEAADEIERLKADLQAATEWADSLMARFEDHYWDSVAKDKDIILLHIAAVINGKRT